MRTPILCLLLLASSVLISTLAIAGGSGTIGGGEWVDVNGHPSLRDLVDNTVCRWQSSDQFAKERPHFAKILENIGGLHWYFATAIRGELPRINVCLTQGDLKRVATEDLDSVTIFAYRQAHQLAVRLNNAIYVDEKALGMMSEPMQSYVLLHETLHSFIPMNTERRNNKLRSMVATIESLETSSMTSDQFGVNMQMDSISIAPTTKDIDSRRENILVALDETKSRDARAAAAHTIEGVKDRLFAADIATIDGLIRSYQDEYVAAVRSNDAAKVTSFLNAGMDQNRYPIEETGSKCATMALQYTVQHDLKAVAQTLLATPTTTVSDDQDRMTYCRHESLIQDAVSTRDTALVRMVLARIDYTPKNLFSENNPMSTAVANNQVEMVQILLNSAIYIDGNGAVIQAMKTGNRAVFEMLVKSPRVKMGGPVLGYLIDQSDLAHLQYIVANGKVDCSQFSRIDWGTGYPEKYAEYVANHNGRSISRKIAKIIHQAADR